MSRLRLFLAMTTVIEYAIACQPVVHTVILHLHINFRLIDVKTERYCAWCSRRRRLTRSSGSWPRSRSRTDLSHSGYAFGQATRSGMLTLKSIAEIIFQNPASCLLLLGDVILFVSLALQWRLQFGLAFGCFLGAVSPLGLLLSLILQCAPLGVWRCHRFATPFPQFFCCVAVQIQRKAKTLEENQIGAVSAQTAWNLRQPDPSAGSVTKAMQTRGFVAPLPPSWLPAQASMCAHDCKAAGVCVLSPVLGLSYTLLDE